MTVNFPTLKRWAIIASPAGTKTSMLFASADVRINPIEQKHQRPLNATSFKLQTIEPRGVRGLRIDNVSI